MTGVRKRIRSFLLPPFASLFFLFLVLPFFSCGGPSVSGPSSRGFSKKGIAKTGYSIQAGAFGDVDNAVHMTERLQDEGLDAYYFVYATGIYKVRFGDFPSRTAALLRARKLQRSGTIDDFYVIRPEDSTASKATTYGDDYLRGRLVSTAKSFLGVPYRWGGSSRRGLDCSGLTMAVYNLNGIQLPHSSRAQFREGDPVKRFHLREGDLVFFATNGGRKVSHVGVYIGKGQFIHAPSSGKAVQAESLSNDYYADRYIGARRYF